MNKKTYVGTFLGIVLSIIIFLVTVMFLYMSGYRFKPLDAAKANFDVGENSVSIGDVDFGWGKVYLFKTSKGSRTVIAIKSGLLWRAPTAVRFDHTSAEVVNTVGWMSYNNIKRQATVFAVETFDPNIVYIEAGPIGMRTTKEVKVGTPVIFSWRKVLQSNELRPLALTNNGVPLYEYRYPKSTNVIRSDRLQWYPVNKDTLPFLEPNTGFPITSGYSQEIIAADKVPTNGSVKEVFNITPKAYVDHWNWNILAGNKKSDPSIGIVVAYYIQQNGPIPDKRQIQKVHTIAGAGKISITGFSGSTVYLRSQTGYGTFTLTPNGENGGKVDWTPNS